MPGPAAASMTGVTLRPFRPGDEGACAAIFNRAWAAALPDLSREMDGAGFLAETGREEVIVAEGPDGRLVGFVSVFRRDAFIHHLFIDPAVQRSGIGTALLDRAVASVGGAATLKCLRRNEGARAFYTRSGWRETEQGADAWGDWSRWEKRSEGAEPTPIGCSCVSASSPTT